MRYPHRLRSRLIVSYVLFGIALTAVFATSAVFLRNWLEDKLIGEALVRNLSDYAHKFYEDPNQELFVYQKIRGYTFSERKFGNVPFAWRDLPNGVYDLNQPDGKEGAKSTSWRCARIPTTGSSCSTTPRRNAMRNAC